ncbi:MAG: hypothetical protein KKI09_01520 [Spirochaetes bacterium]|nr:hypothetical protein [Spirochaetota bacterium]MBU0954082.1 hypothetical protein [Spirochaetota bacterium]
MKKLGVFGLICLFYSFSLAALDLDSAVGRFGVAILNNTVPDSAPSPVLNTLGGSIAISFSEGFWLQLEPGLDLLWTNYGNYDGRAVPVEYEAGDGNNVFVLGFLLDLPLVAAFRFGPVLVPELEKRFLLSFSLGPAFLLRAGFKGDTTAEVADKMLVNQAAVNRYFWEQGRWFYPAAALRFETLLQDQFTFVLGVRALVAAANWWTGVVPWTDHLTTHVMLGMRVQLGARSGVPAMPDLEANVDANVEAGENGLPAENIEAEPEQTAIPD